METTIVRHMRYLPYIGIVMLPNTPRIEYLLQHEPIVPKEYTTLKKVIITALVVMLSGLFGLLFREPGLPAALGFWSAVIMGIVWFIHDLRISACHDRRFNWGCAVYDEYCRHTKPKQQRRYWTAKEIIAIRNGSSLEKGEMLFKQFVQPCKGNGK